MNEIRIAGIRDVETMSRIKSRRQQRKREPGESGNDVVDQRQSEHRRASAFTATLLVSGTSCRAAADGQKQIGESQQEKLFSFTAADGEQSTGILNLARLSSSSA
jgi:hypothetical protein